MTNEEKVGALLLTQKHMVVAVTLADGSPWAVPVAIRDHEGLGAFMWDSALQTEHSKALESNSAMAITIYQKQEDAQIGFYAKGRGELLEEFKPGFGHYRFVADKAWINDETFVKRPLNLV